MTVCSYRDLTAWRVGIELIEDVYNVTRTFPKSETYGICSHMQRAAVSVPSNIAEGHQRDSTREYLHFISIALGSVAELDTLITVCERLGYMNNQAKERLGQKADSVGRMLRGLQKSLKMKLGDKGHRR